MLRKIFFCLGLITFLVIFNPTVSSAQFKIDVFTGIATNPVDDPVLWSIGHSPEFAYKKFSISYALDINLNKRDEKIINAFSSSLAYTFTVAKNPLKASIIYRYTPVSTILNIQKAGILLDYQIGKWAFGLGNNFNIYRYNKNAVEVYDITDNPYLVESANLMYAVKYSFRDIDSPWNLYLNLSNYELFLIEQEINPMLNLGFTYKHKENSPTFFADVWYQTAGFFNIRVNYYGMFFRTGVSWEIE